MIFVGYMMLYEQKVQRTGISCYSHLDASSQKINTYQLINIIADKNMNVIRHSVNR